MRLKHNVSTLSVQIYAIKCRRKYLKFGVDNKWKFLTNFKVKKTCRKQKVISLTKQIKYCLLKSSEWWKSHNLIFFVLSPHFESIGSLLVLSYDKRYKNGTLESKHQVSWMLNYLLNTNFQLTLLIPKACGI